jgi:hypothetical protein
MLLPQSSSVLSQVRLTYPESRVHSELAVRLFSLTQFRQARWHAAWAASWVHTVILDAT